MPKCNTCVHYEVCKHNSKYTNIVPDKDISGSCCSLYRSNFNLKNIKRIDISVENTILNSDGKPVIATGVEKYAVLFNDTQISEKEANKLIKSGAYVEDSRLAVMSPETADKLKDIICCTKKKGENNI